MKFLYSIILLFSASLNANSNMTFSAESKLKPCPNAPNCVSTQETRPLKRMGPIQYIGSVDSAIVKLEKLIATYPNARLIKKESNYLHYTFITKIGKFIDDVEFIIDEKTKQIHFRSASRTGYGDLGKNRRRMRKIRKLWNKINND